MNAVAEATAGEQEDFTRYTLWFAFACIIYSIVGFSWGAIMGGVPSLRNYVDHSAYGKYISLAHGHINLLGWVEMAIFASLYYIVPRLAKRPIYSVTLVKVHFWMHNFGLLGMVVFFVLAGVVGGSIDVENGEAMMHAVHMLMALMGSFGMIVLLANIIWGYNLFRTAYGWKSRQ